MRRLLSFLLSIGLALLLVFSSIAQYSDTGVRAEAQNTVNLRAYPGSDTDILGQMQIGLEYVVIGRHELFPWLLLAEPASLRPVGWAFRDIVQVTGNLNSVPLSDVVVSSNSATPTLAQSAAATSSGTSLQASSTPAFNVAGTALGEINIRYGPGVDYPRVGIGQAGERFQIIGYHTQFPWVQISYEGSPTGKAWIAIDLLDIQGDIFSTERISNTVFNQPTLTPTPAVVQSVAGLSDTGANASPEFLALGNRLYQLALSSGFDPQTSLFGSLFIVDLQTGESIAFGNNVAYSGTSVNKISILATLYGSLNGLPQQSLATDIADTMICSHNTSTNRLLAVIGNQDEWSGASQVTDFLRLIGVQNSYLLAPYVADPAHPPIPDAPIPVPDTEVDQAIAFPEPYNQVTVQDLAMLMVAIYQCAYEESGPLIDNFPAGAFDPRECRQMLHVMASNNVDSLLRSGVPASVRVAHKHGWIDDTHMNAAVFFTDGGNYVVAMALHSNQLDAEGNRYISFDKTLPVFAETSRQIYNYFNPETPSLELRESFIPEAPGCNFANSPLIGDLMQPVWDN
jgi:uncharacterized protein YraI